jgi:hypothetical protein
VGGEQHHPGGTEAEQGVEAGHPEPVPTGHAQRAPEPPGVEQQGDPGDRTGDEHPPAERQDDLVGQQGEQPAAGREHQKQHQAADQQAGQPHPDGEATDPTVAHHELGRAGHHEGHEGQRQGAAELHALGGFGGMGVRAAEHTHPFVKHGVLTGEGNEVVTIEPQTLDQRSRARRDTPNASGRATGVG